MLAKAKHRRFKNGPLTRGLVAMSAGGAVLALPLVASASASAATPTTNVAEAAPAAAPTATKAAATTYTVVAGDSLSKIAKAQSVSGGWQRLYQNNRQVVGVDPNLIHPGQQLRLGGPALAQTSGSTAGSSSATGSSAGSVSVKSGDAATSAASVTTKATAAAPTSTKTYTDNLTGWIDQSLDVMAAHGIPGSYNGIYRNVMRESSGNPQAINDWDSNAAKGTPSKGLLQVIQPTFDSYHVSGTSMDIYDPVANITAACNYAFHVYGSIDNVNGPY